MLNITGEPCIIRKCTHLAHISFVPSVNSVQGDNLARNEKLNAQSKDPLGCCSNDYFIETTKRCCANGIEKLKSSGCKGQL